MTPGTNEVFSFLCNTSAFDKSYLLDCQRWIKLKRDGEGGVGFGLWVLGSWDGRGCCGMGGTH